MVELKNILHIGSSWRFFRLVKIWRKERVGEVGDIYMFDQIFDKYLTAELKLRN